MIKVICDICGKEMPKRKEKPIDVFDFSISTYDKEWDICDECRVTLNGLADKKEKVKTLAKAIIETNIPRCKNCKYFEYDSVANVDGIPLIVAHEICSKWGEGCKTKEDGYCFLWEDKDEQK